MSDQYLEAAQSKYEAMMDVPDADWNAEEYVFNIVEAWVGDADTTKLGSEAKTVDLTRYRRCEKCDGERLIPNHETNLIERCDCREGFIPDDTLQQIANAWKTVANCGPEATLQEWNAAQDNLNALLNGLVNDESKSWQEDVIDAVDCNELSERDGLSILGYEGDW